MSASSSEDWRTQATGRRNAKASAVYANVLRLKNKLVMRRGMICLTASAGG
jgi:hypothetical protein